MATRPPAPTERRPASTPDARDGRLGVLTELFGSYKAEWLEQGIYDLFARPAYFPHLTTNQSCVLLGGRGTGKTTALRGLSYEGQKRLIDVPPPEWERYGLYYKVDEGVMSAFMERGLTDAEWQRPFGHHMNLLFSDLVFDFLSWYEAEVPDARLDTRGAAWRLYERRMALRFPPARDHTVGELAMAVKEALIDLELYANNVGDGETSSTFSVIGTAVDALIDAVRTLPGFANKTFYFLIDEYETLTDYQQRVCNTLIKRSAGKPYSFKVGVKELGWRQRYTLHGQELRDPSDYRRIDIAKELEGTSFNAFAYEVFLGRFARLVEVEDGVALEVGDLFPSLTLYEEAEMLGVEKLASRYLRAVSSLTEAQAVAVQAVHPALVWFVGRWGEGEGWSTEESLRALAASPRTWERRFQVNYGYGALFAIRAGKGHRVRKLYAGWDVYLKLASGNIRFFLQLVEEALSEHVMRDRSLSRPISPEDQTKAARQVGLRNFQELEGLDVRGARMMKLLLGLGRLFQLMAWDPFKHAPELNQFTPKDEEAPEGEAAVETVRLLEASVNHLALQRSGSTKLGRDSDPRGFDYWIHPIYSAFFQISHRRKRKTTLSLDEIYALTVDQRRAIVPILERHGRSPEAVDEVPLPPQLNLFYPPPGADG